jgi:hypothetical protein
MADTDLNQPKTARGNPPIANPTPNGTPAQKAVEKVVGLDTPKLQAATPISAKEAAIQSAQPAPEFTGNVQKGSGIWRGTAGYRPVGPKLPVTPEGVPTPIQQTIEAKAGVGPQSDVRPMSADEAVLQKSMGDAKAAGAERVAAAKQAVQSAAPSATTVVDTTAPKYASEAARANAMGLATSLAGSVIQSPKIAQQTNDALRRQGLKGIVPQQDGGEMPVTQFGRWLGGKVYDITHPSPEQAKKETVQQPTAEEQNTATPEPMSMQSTNFATGTQLPGGGTVGAQEPVIDFSHKPATVPLKQGQTEMQRAEEIEKTAQEKGQAVSKGSGGNFRYVQGPNGSVVKQNTDTGEVVPMSVQGITGNILKPGEQSPLAKEVETRKAARAAEKEEAFRNQLIAMAQDQGDGTFTGMGEAKRNRQFAMQLLDQMDKSKQAAAQLGMEGKKLDATERATEATREQNALYKQQEADDRKTQLGLTERRTVAAEKAAAGKAVKETYKDKTFQGTPDSIAQQKQDYDRELFQKSWAKDNPKGMMEDAKVYKARQVLAANAKYPMYNAETNSPLQLRMDTEGNLYTRGPNGEAIPYM